MNCNNGVDRLSSSMGCHVLRCARELMEDDRDPVYVSN
jgi:hypothetical protein